MLNVYNLYCYTLSVYMHARLWYRTRECVLRFHLLHDDMERFTFQLILNRLLHSWGTKLRFLLFKTSVYHVFVCANIVSWSPPWSVSIVVSALPPAVFYMVNLRGMCFIVLINHLHAQLWNRVITISLLHSSCQSRSAASIDTRAATYNY